MPQFLSPPNGLKYKILLVVGLFSLLFAAVWLIDPHWRVRSYTHAELHQPDWQWLVFSNETNTFALSLVVRTADASHGSNCSRSADRWVAGRRITHKLPKRKRYTFAELAEIADDDWIHPIPRSAYMLYPQALDMKLVLSDIRNFRPVPEAPIFNQTIRFLNVSSKVCVPGKPIERHLDAIVVIKSAVYNFAERERLRRVYAKEAKRETTFRMIMVFSIGLPRSSGGRFFQREGLNISLPGRAGDSLQKMQSKRSEVLSKLAEESRINGDLVLGDYEDTYYNLTVKLFHTFQWASRFCRGYFTHQQRPPVFIFMDDDYAFNASLMKAELGALSDAKIRRVALGSPLLASRVYRPMISPGFEKWILSKHQVPWPYHAPYFSGTFFILGADVLQEIALAMYFNQQFHVDDAWLGIIMTKLNISVHCPSSMHTHWLKVNKKELVLFAPFDYLFGQQ
uniref:Hexosyltransferase n=1 Tax=Schistocephalus solidus TaxID=70667 RepID=A0A0X3Q3J4_SCHSO